MKALVVAAVAVLMVVVSACGGPVYYVHTISGNGTVLCVSGSFTRTYHVTSAQLRSIRVGDRCPN